MEPADGRTDLTTSLMLSVTSVVCSVSMAFPCHKLNNGTIQPPGRIAPGKTTANSFLRAEGWKDLSVGRMDCLDVGDMSFPKLSCLPFMFVLPAPLWRTSFVWFLRYGQLACLCSTKIHGMDNFKTTIVHHDFFTMTSKDCENLMSCWSSSWQKKYRL